MLSEIFLTQKIAYRNALYWWNRKDNDRVGTTNIEVQNQSY